MAQRVAPRTGTAGTRTQTGAGRVEGAVGRVDGATKASPRDRLLAAANELFYAEGVQTVGIDRIIERAGVAKASLYNTFGSKEALIAAYLESRHSGTTGRLGEVVARAKDPRARVLAVFDAQAALFGEPDFRGCAFVAASAEAPPGGLVEQATDEFRSWVLGLFTDLAEQFGAKDPGSLGRQLQLIYDGAGLSARMDRTPAAATAARAAAEAVLEASMTDRAAATDARSHLIANGERPGHPPAFPGV